MNLDNLKLMARAIMPKAKLNTIDNELLELILNNGAKDVASKSLCLPANATFDSTADTYTSDYNLNTVISRYLTMDRAGLWYRESTSSQYKRLFPKTIEWMDKHYPTWRDVSASDPTHYLVDKNKITVYPGTDTVIINAFKIYFYQLPTDMTDGSHYPFGNTSELTHLQPLSDAVLAYWEWRAAKILGESEQVIVAKEAEYGRILSAKIVEVNRRLDVGYDKHAKLQGRIIR